MYIGLIIYGTLDTISGGYLYDRKLVEHLRAAGHQIEILSLPWRSYRAHLTDNWDRPLSERLLRAKYDVLLQDELNHPSLVILNQQLKPHIDYPIISIVHHLRCVEERPRWQNAIYRAIERQYLKTVDGFVYNSLTTRQTVEDLIGPTSHAVVAQPAGDRFASTQAKLARHQSDDPHKLHLLFVGNIIPRKGLHTLLKALDHLPAGRWQLDVIGSSAANPPYAAAMRSYVTARPWNKNVTFWDDLTDDQLAIRFAASHLLVVPSSYEGFGIVYLEAMSFGIPAIATTAGAAREIITHNHNGFLIKPNDAHQLAEHIRLLIEQPEKRAQLSQHALETFNLFPTWTQSCEAVHQYLLNFN